MNDEPMAMQTEDLQRQPQKRALLPELSREFTAIMEAEGISMADLLQGLEEERKAIARKRQIGKAQGL